MNTALTPLRKEKGVVLVLVALSLVLLVGMAGLSLDLSHAYLNKTRLQNAVDAAALAGANVLNERLGSISGTPTSAQVSAAKSEATSEIENIFSSANNSNTQLNVAISAKPTIEFSNTFFDPATSTLPLYVRVTSPNVSYQSWFIQVLMPGQTSKNIATSAVAGVSPSTNCVDNLVPIMLCAVGNKASNWGYTFGERIKLDSKFDTSGTTIKGNFMFLDTGCPNNSASCLEEQLAGAGKSPTLCLGNTPTKVGTNPGAMTGPTADGLNTRFGIYSGDLKNSQADYPGDSNQTCYSLATNDITSHDNYLSGAPGIDDPNSKGKSSQFCDTNKAGGTPGNGRRELVVPIVDCDGTHGGVTPGNGNTEVSVLDIGCLFLDVPADDASLKEYCVSPSDDVANGVTNCADNKQDISARLIEKCSVSGFSSNTRPTTFKLKTVQLYKNPGSNDS
jgi:Flp pilus assembly protein TadG